MAIMQLSVFGCQTLNLMPILSKVRFWMFDSSTSFW
jgi:hypothetical protein